MCGAELGLTRVVHTITVPPSYHCFAQPQLLLLVNITNNSSMVWRRYAIDLMPQQVPLREEDKRTGMDLLGKRSTCTPAHRRRTAQSSQWLQWT